MTSVGKTILAVSATMVWSVTIFLCARTFYIAATFFFQNNKKKERKERLI